MVGRALGRATAKATQRATDFARKLRDEYRAGLAEERSHTDDDAASVAEAMRKIDWRKVTASTRDAARDTAAAMRGMAAQVDWSKVQPMAAEVSSALIAAVASGELQLGGTLGGRVARAIMNDDELGRRVAANLRRTHQSPPNYRDVIETTAREV